MSTKIQNIELEFHPMWKKIQQVLSLPSIQGYNIQATEHALIQATMGSKSHIPFCFLEAGEYESNEELIPEYFFTKDSWLNKLASARFFHFPLLFLSRGISDHYLFRLHEVVSDTKQRVSFKPKMVFPNESSFTNWWKKIKVFQQTTTKVHNAAQRVETLFSHLLEKNNLQWGNNFDGLLLTDDKKSVKAIVELRQTWETPLKDFDPSKNFEKIDEQTDEFRSWLPLVYLQKTYRIPLILVTLSHLNPNQLGWAQVEGMNFNRLFYRYEIPPAQNAGADIEIFMNWLGQIC